MEREIIERLAMDSASGELNEDVETLLQEYLSEHNDVNKWFLEMRDIYNKTQAAFDAKTAFIKQHKTDNPSLKFNWFPVMRWAAVIIIAVCIGAAAGRLSKQKAPLQKHNVVATDTSFAKKTTFNPGNISNDFWRNKITAMVNPSPVKIHIEKSSGSSLLETYKKYIKESNHE